MGSQRRVSALIGTFAHAQTEIWTATDWDRFKELVERFPAPGARDSCQAASAWAFHPQETRREGAKCSIRRARQRFRHHPRRVVFRLSTPMRQRRSVRSFRDRTLAKREVGQLLWAAQGITGDDGNRAVASAGALYPLERYAAVGDVASFKPRCTITCPRSMSSRKST